MSAKRIVKVKAGERKRGRTDFARLDRMTDEEIEAAANADPDNPPATAEWLKSAKLVDRRPKEAISIRIDADVLAWFRAQGSGYQSTMNAVLRSYVDHRRTAAVAERIRGPFNAQRHAAPAAKRKARRRDVR